MQQDTLEGTPTPPLSLRGVLSPEELARFRTPQLTRTARDLALIWAQIGAGLALFVAFPNPLTFLIAFVVIGGGQHGLLLAAHEFVHYSAIPSSRTWNDRIGNWFFSGAVGTPLRVFRHRHFLHHRFYSTDRDTKHVYRRPVRGRELLWETLKSLVGYDYLYHLKVVRQQDAADQAAGRRPGPPNRETVPGLLAIHAVIFAGFALIDPLLYFALWIAPIVTVAQLLHKLRSWVEHHPLPEDMRVASQSGYFGGTEGPFVRSVAAAPLERLLGLCRINFGYHVEHHLWPQISYQWLPTVRQRLRERGSFEDPRFGVEESYTHALLKLWRPAASPPASGSAPV